MTGVETVLSLCEVEIFSAREIGVSSCSQRLPPDEVAVFQDTCYHFVPGETAGYDEADAKCREFDGEYHLLAELDPHAVSYLSSSLEQRSPSSASSSLMTWVGARRESRFGQEKWTWVTSEPVGEIDWGRGQPNNYNQEQNCAVLDSELDWKWNDISCK